jgi:acyl-CoA thioester hydrolase
MSRVRIDIPQSFPFQTQLTIRVSDLNYGGHLGNDKVLTLAHEARVAYLKSIGATELAIGEGAGLIMADAAIEFKAEAHLGDNIRISVAVTNLGRAGFDMIYKMDILLGESTRLMALVRTGMVSFNYARKKVVSIPEVFRNIVTSAS